LKSDKYFNGEYTTDSKFFYLLVENDELIPKKNWIVSFSDKYIMKIIETSNLNYYLYVKMEETIDYNDWS